MLEADALTIKQKKLNEATAIIIQIEEKRDDIAYSAPATEQLLQEKINLYSKHHKTLRVLFVVL